MHARVRVRVRVVGKGGRLLTAGQNEQTARERERDCVEGSAPFPLPQHIEGEQERKSEAVVCRLTSPFSCTSSQEM